MNRVYNFSAGPATLPEAVLEQAANEMLDWQGTRMGVMEMSHRGPAFMQILEAAEADLRELLKVPQNYKILFMQGGAIAENAIVPLNLLGTHQQADYVITGGWSQKSYQEAQRYCRAHIAASSQKDNFAQVPALETWEISPDSAYVWTCTNETVWGVEYPFEPDLSCIGRADVPVVADMSSHILSKPMDVSRYGVIFAGAQKNIGPAGLTLVIVREDLLGKAHPLCPDAFNYKLVADNQSMYNTPPTYSIYIAGLVFKWLKKQGGLLEIEKYNRAKADLLYSTLDASEFYQTRIAPHCRSMMNVSFFLADERLNADFLAGAEAAGLKSLKGHKSLGGMRASIYNAMPRAGVEALVAYMKDFEQRKA